MEKGHKKEYFDLIYIIKNRNANRDTLMGVIGIIWEEIVQDIITIKFLP